MGFKTVVNKINMHHINMLRGLQTYFIECLFIFNKLCMYIGLRKSPFMLKMKPVSYLMHEFLRSLIYQHDQNFAETPVAHNLLLASCL